MSVQNFNIHKAMRSYERLHAETLDLLAEGHEHAAAFLKAEEGIRVKVEHYFEKLRTANQKMEGIVTSLTGKVNAYQLKEYQTDLEQLKKKVALVQSFFLEKKVEERAEEGKSDQEEALPASRASAPLPDEMRLEVLQRLPLQELSEMRRVSKGWNALYNSAIKEELTLLAATFYPKDAVAAQAFKETLYASLADRPDNRKRDGIDKLSSTECLLLAALITNNIADFQQEERLSSTFPLLHSSLRNALAMQATLESEGLSNTPYLQTRHLQELVHRLLDIKAIPQAIALATGISCVHTQSSCLSSIAQRAPDCGHSLEEVMAILRAIPLARLQEHAAGEIVKYLTGKQKMEDAIQLMLHFPVHIATIKKTIDLLNGQKKLERAISFVRDLQHPYKKSQALQQISSLLMEQRATEEAISLAREIPNERLKADQLYTLVTKLTDRKRFKEALELAESMEILDGDHLDKRWLALEKVVEGLAMNYRFQEALTLAHEKITHPLALSYALNRVIDNLLPENRKPWNLARLCQAVDIARSMPDLRTQSHALVGLVKKQIHSGYFSEAIDLMEMIQTPEEKDNALSELIFCGRIGKLIDRERELTLVRKMADPSRRSQRLLDILRDQLFYINNETDIAAVRALAEEITTPWMQADALHRIVQFMLQRGDDRAHILAMAQQIRYEEVREQALKLIP